MGERGARLRDESRGREADAEEALDERSRPPCPGAERVEIPHREGERGERNSRPGIRYALTDDGVELPVIDLTHPAFGDVPGQAAQEQAVTRYLKSGPSSSARSSWRGPAVPSI